jgi:bifunctional DNA-binding transcriptional regulator/antitoxin component of YhaV-PrlF toxin-antitoxin module
MTNQTENNVRYEVITFEDDNGDVILPIPPQILKEMGWKEGDELDIGVDDNGKIYLKKVFK